MPFLRRPSAGRLAAYLAREAAISFSYGDPGVSRQGRLAGFDLDENAVTLGHGPAVFDAARAALLRWQQFPSGWTFIFPGDAPIVPGAVIAMTARVLGLWWPNSCRIVYTVDEPGRFGYAYGTLPGHVERGEELFLLEQAPDGMVTYHIRAVSRPRFWLARLGYPLVRFFQRRFVRDSQRAMLAAVAGQLHPHPFSVR